jgi:hypothetical protein
MLHIARYWRRNMTVCRSISLQFLDGSDGAKEATERRSRITRRFTGHLGGGTAYPLRARRFDV